MKNVSTAANTLKRTSEHLHTDLWLQSAEAHVLQKVETPQMNPHVCSVCTVPCNNEQIKSGLCRDPWEPMRPHSGDYFRSRCSHVNSPCEGVITIRLQCPWQQPAALRATCRVSGGAAPGDSHLCTTHLVSAWCKISPNLFTSLLMFSGRSHKSYFLMMSSWKYLINHPFIKLLGIILYKSTLFSYFEYKYELFSLYHLYQSVFFII